MAAAFTNRARLRSKISDIPKNVQKAIIPVMADGANRVVALQRELVRVEQPPGAHAKGSNRERAHSAGAEKASIEVTSKSGGLKLVISAVAAAIPNLGLWLEYGTRGGQKGGSYAARRKNGHGQPVLRARKVYRTHPGTRPYPFFFPPWHALAPSILDGMKAAWRSAIDRTKSS